MTQTIANSDAARCPKERTIATARSYTSSFKASQVSEKTSCDILINLSTGKPRIMQLTHWVCMS